VSKKKITREQVAHFIRNANEDDANALMRLTNAVHEEWRVKNRADMACMDFLEKYEEPF
jgi:transcriptional regulator of NAD metabolism